MVPTKSILNFSNNTVSMNFSTSNFPVLASGKDRKTHLPVPSLAKHSRHARLDFLKAKRLTLRSWWCQFLRLKLLETPGAASLKAFFSFFRGLGRHWRLRQSLGCVRSTGLDWWSDHRSEETTGVKWRFPGSMKLEMVVLRGRSYAIHHHAAVWEVFGLPTVNSRGNRFV